MSGETEKNVSAHTVDTLNQMIAQRFRDLERLLDERHGNQQEALNAALATAQREISRTNAEIAHRFESVNQFREQLREQAGTFLSRAESDATHRELRSLIASLDKRVTEVSQALVENRGQDKGAAEQAAARRATNAQIIALAAVFLTAISIAVGLILALNG